MTAGGCRQSRWHFHALVLLHSFRLDLGNTITLCDAFPFWDSHLNGKVVFINISQSQCDLSWLTALAHRNASFSLCNWAVLEELCRGTEFVKIDIPRHPMHRSSVFTWVLMLIQPYASLEKLRMLHTGSTLFTREVPVQTMTAAQTIKKQLPFSS